MKIINLFFFPFILTCFLIAQPQNIRFEKLTIEDGLSNKQIRCILQDRQGFMWFAAEDGLYKYDGYTFTAYKNDPKDSLSLSSNKVTVLFEDYLGNLWIGTYWKGLCRYDPDRDAFIRYKRDNPDGDSFNMIVSIFETEQHILWIATGYGIMRYNREENNFSWYYPDKKPLHMNANFIGGITEDRSGKLWIGTWNQGLFYYNTEKDMFIKYKPYHEFSKNFINQFTDQMSSSYWQGNNYLWFGCYQNGLYKINLQNGQIKHYIHQPGNPASLSDNNITTIFVPEKENNEIWIGTRYGGLNKLNIQTEKFTHYMYQPEKKSNLNDYVISIAKDKSGLMWIGTAIGINIFNPKPPGFNKINHSIDNRVDFSGDVIFAIHETGEAHKSSILWLGTVFGLYQWDRTTGLFTLYKHNPRDISSLSNNYVMDIIESRFADNNFLWVGTLNGLNRISPKTKKIKRFSIPHNDPAYNQILSLCEDKQGMIWIGTQSTYLYSFDPQTEQFVRHQKFGLIQAIYQDTYGKLWIGTTGGIYNYDPITKTKVRYKPVKGDTTSISDGTIFDIFEDKNKNLWVATEMGLNKYNRSMDTFTRFLEKDGLPSNYINAILEDSNGNLWLSSDKGISKFNPINKKAVNFLAADGLHDNRFANHSCYMNQRGEMFFGGWNGLTWFHPDSIKKESSFPPIVLTDLRIFNQSIKPGKCSPLKKHVSLVKEIRLTHDQNIFSFEFAALEYQNPKRIRYAYQMEGVDPDWVETDATHRFATYTQLDPGQYLFHVKGSNSDGLWNPQATTLKIIIIPSWYRTNWAYNIYIVLTVFILLAIRHFEIKRIKLRNTSERLQEIDKLKSRFFANISHEFRTPLTLILGPVNKLIEGKPDKEKFREYTLIQRNAFRLQRLVNQLLDLSRFEAGRLQLQATKLDIVQLSKSIMASFESHARLCNIKLLFHTSEERLDIYIDPDKYEKILTNLLSNAFKFSDDNTEIHLSINKVIDSPIAHAEGDCRIKVSDQGIGIPGEFISRVFDRFYQVDSSSSRAYEGSGIGLALVKELVELHKGSISVESRPDYGSTFSVIIPLGEKHLSADEIVKLPADKIVMTNYNPLSTDTREITAEMETDNQLSHLLIVEDNTDVQKYIAGFLKEEYNIMFAADGLDGLNKAIKNIPDLIISDMMMPVMDGFEMCEKIKSHQATSHIPVILLTARAGQENKLSGLQKGADAYLTKPFDVRELRVRIGNLIEQRRKLQERFNRLNPLNPQKLEIGKNDRSFLHKAIAIVKENMDNPSFNANQFAKEIALSHVQLFRKLKSISDKSVTEFIRYIRIQHAAQLLKQDQANVSEAAYRVGFNNLSYFSENFKKQYGVSPSQFLKEKNINPNPTND